MANAGPVLYDSYGRPLSNLRISVTPECNYRCIFCHLEGDPRGRPVSPGGALRLLEPGEFEIVAEAARVLGISSIKITGGEPLVRRDIVSIVGGLRAGHPEADLSMTTNGYLLSRYATQLREAGLDRVNVSIHSLRREVYKFITGVDGLDRALEGLRAAVDAGFAVKVNAVLLRGVNDAEVWDLIGLASRYNAVLQLIELHPVGLGARFFNKYYMSLDGVEAALRERSIRVERRGLHNRPVYVLDNGVRVEVVRPYNNPLFCAGCTRVRLLPEGLLSPCLNWRGPLVDLASRVRTARSRSDKVAAAVEAFIEVNRLRKPFFMWRIGYEPLDRPRRGGLRLRLPKAGPAQVALRAVQ